MQWKGNSWIVTVAAFTVAIVCGSLVMVFTPVSGKPQAASIPTKAVNNAVKLPQLTLAQPSVVKVSTCLNWSVACSPTTTAQIIERELVRYHSPMTGLGQHIYALGSQYQVDPNFFMAIAYSESNYATVNSYALTNRNPGSLKSGRGGATREYGGFAVFDSWPEGIEAFYRHISTSYFSQGRTTVDEILWKYAPPKENNTPAYIRSIKARMDALRSQ